MKGLQELNRDRWNLGVKNRERKDTGGNNCSVCNYYCYKLFVITGLSICMCG